MNSTKSAPGTPPQVRTPAEVERIVHELQVHQLELEMQNDELRRSQLELDLSRARYFDLYDLAPVGYCTISEAGVILEANLTAANLLGVTRADLVKRPLSQFIFRGDQDLYFLCRNKVIREGARQACELRLEKADGGTFWASLDTSTAQDADGGPVHRVMISDVSQRKRLDEALNDTNARLELARAEADKASLAKSEFLSSMSHELRSPLNAILGFAQLMDLAAPDPVQKANVAQILKAGWYLLALVNEILDLAAIESGKVTLSLEPTSMADVLADCQAMIEPQVNKSGIQVTLLPVASDCFVAADRTRLKQVLINLLSNALKYNQPGGTVRVTVAHRTPERVRISVEDTGDGLIPEKVAQLFQSFNRLGREIGPEEGTGIGLMVSKRLVELMGGSIGVRSTPGEGSVFWFELNAAAAQVLAARASLPARPGKPRLEGEPRTVLYVEDNPANMKLVEQLIARRPDLRLLGAVDGTRGIALARSEQPAVILMDINLPGISGLQALQILRSDPATANIPVLALSANAMVGDIDKGMAAGFLRYLTKPIRIHEFMHALDLALERGPPRIAP